MKILNNIIFVFSASLFFNLSVHAGQAAKGKTEVLDKVEEAKVHAELMSVIQVFQESIVKKDDKKFINLFLNEYTPWIGVYADQPKGSKIPAGMRIETWWGFVSWFVNDPAPIEEKIYNVDIKTDGTVASLYFDYEFYINKKLSHWGKEAWQLLKIEGLWKINSLNYSIYLPDEKKK